MRTTSLLLLLASTSAFTFTSPSRADRTAATKLFMADVAKTVPIVITGNNIEVTPALMDYVNKKLDRTLGKLSNSGAIMECDVHLSVNKNPKVKNAHKAEVTTSLKGMTIRSSEESPDMYASIDLVSDRLARKLRKYKERRLNGYHGGPNIGENLADVLDEIEEEPEDAAPVASIEEEFLDPEGEVNITKIKSFDLSKATSVKEAVFALDYVDHDFFVFRNEETDQVSVVYKRNAGGIGLIEPQKD